MSRVKQAYEALGQAIREEYGLEPRIVIDIFPSRQSSQYDYLRCGLAIQADYGANMRYSDNKEEETLYQWVEVGPIVLFAERNE